MSSATPRSARSKRSATTAPSGQSSKKRPKRDTLWATFKDTALSHQPSTAVIIEILDFVPPTEDRLLLRLWLSRVQRLIDNVKQDKKDLPGVDFPLPPPPTQPAVEDHLVVKAFAEAQRLAKQLSVASDEYQAYVAEINARPAPNEYAKPSVWGEYQNKSGAIRCLRPAEKRGLPLSMMDDVFLQFERHRDSKLPDTGQAGVIFRIATRLCEVMPASFLKETEREKAFNDAIKPLLTWHHEYRVTATSELHSGRIDSCHIVEDTVLIIREEKLDLGSGNDGYMQGARDYQIYTEGLRDNDRDLFQRGAPTFIMAVQGPLLVVSGAFHDGKDPLVELLGQEMMLPDDKLYRVDKVARLLFALAQGVETLGQRVKRRSTLAPETSPRPAAEERDAERAPIDLQRRRTQAPASSGSENFKPGVPRLYPSFKPLDGSTEIRIIFLHPFDEDEPMMFVAESERGDRLFVKFTNHKYGEDIHQHLADIDLAPKLRGRLELQGNPTGYVMDLLPPPSEDHPGWVTLTSFAKSEGAQNHALDIRTSMDAILDLLEAEHFVHADLRPNNLMIKVNSNKQPVAEGDAKVCLMVVDFDWGGVAGEKSYPYVRNERIQWPTEAGRPIQQHDDRRMMNTWWPELFGNVGLDDSALPKRIDP